VILTNGTLTAHLELWPGWGGITGLEKSDDFFAYVYEFRYLEIESFQPSKLEAARVAGYEAAFYPVESDRVNTDGLFERGLVSVVLPNNSAFVTRITTESANEPIESVYEFLDTLDAGTRLVCVLFADPGIRIRQEPATDSPVVRETGDENVIALSTTTDAGGNVWFNVGEGFIRSDVIFYEQNACAGIPED
jgi:hypothetical protein